MRRLAVVLSVGAAFAGAAGGCRSEDHPPPAPGSFAGQGSSEDGGLDFGDGGDEPSGPCGDQSISAVVDPPNLYFVLDRSGSMGEELAGSGFSKYENARIALGSVLRAIGHRVNYGAAVFPALANELGCLAGEEIFPVQAGDPPSYARNGENGPRLQFLLGALDRIAESGGTPVAATLRGLLPELVELPGTTYVLLLTDGAPNCNDDLTCEASGCAPSIEQQVSRGVQCSPTVNCCTGPDAVNCVDSDASREAVAALLDENVRTFVLGMPGSEPYAAVLNAMAEAGGTARDDEEKRYFAVSDTAALTEALRAIAASVAISCDLPLDYSPPDDKLVNVYFDGEAVPFDETEQDGWHWADSTRITLEGAACRRLKEGEVLEVQILAGCPTVVE